MSARIYSPDAHLNAFGEWIVSKGGFIQESLTFTAPGSESGSQVNTASEIPPNSKLLTCPHALAIDYTKVKAHYSPSFIAAVTPHAALCMFLAYQWLQGEKSFWYPYLRVLPREFDTPLYFEDEDLMWLQGCNLDVKEVDERKRAWKEEFGVAIAALKEEGGSTEGYTWGLFLWASTVFSSRSFSGKLMAWTDDLSMATLREPDSLPALFPLIDSVNHQPLTKIIWQAGAHELSAVSGETIPPGGQVCNNYGPKSNEELLMGYGFTLPSNPFDTVVLRLNPPLSPEQKAIHSTYAALDSFSTEGIYHLSRRINGSTSYPRGLIALFNILTATPAELPALANSPQAKLTLRNNLATHNQLLVALRQKVAGFPREPDLPPCNNSKRRTAKVYRDIQIEILVGAIMESEGIVQDTLDENSGAVTLSSLLETSTPFREAIEGCFGTVDEEELDEEEQGDIVFTLYICWQYILYIRGNRDQKSMWKEWFARLVTENKYGSTDEKEEVKEAGEFVKELYDGIFPVAAGAAPAVFGGSEWTPELLSWGMRIFGGEGVGLWVSEDEEVFVVCVE